MPIPGGPPPSPSDCHYTVSPVERITMPLGESSVVLVETADHCAWTVQPGADWLSLNSPPGGIGTALINYTAAQNTASFTSSFREAPLMVRWEAETVGQNVWIRQMPRCAMIVMSPPGTTPVVTAAPNNGEFFLDVPAAGGRFPLWTLVEPPFSCPWSARSQAEWIDMEYPVFPTFYRGDGGFAFFVEANTTGVTRIGKIEVGEKFLTVTQPPQ
jgi:hypothetical protein